MDLNFRTLRADEIECRVSQINDKGLLLLLYKDARCDMTLLDEAVGPMNWTRTHSRDNANCTVSIYDDERTIWVGKEDTGTESNTEAAKGLASDSFKRACVNWGIGRELYTAPVIFVKAGTYNVKQSLNGKTVCSDSFSVSRIEYTADRKISALEIINRRSGSVVYQYGVRPNHNAQSPQPSILPPAPQEQPKPAPPCAKCKNKLPIEDTEWQGVKYTGREFATNTYKVTGEPLCGLHFTKWQSEHGTAN